MSEWRNWGGNVSAPPRAGRSTSARVHAVADAVRRAASSAAGAGGRVRPLVHRRSSPPTALLLHVDRLSGVVGVDRERRRVRVLAGTPLHVLNPALQALGLALPNLGDIDRQTIAGAIATGTHGTGTRRRDRRGGQRAHAGARRRVDARVLGARSSRRCSARPGSGSAPSVSSTEVELQCVPAFRLHAKEARASLTELLPRHPGRGRRDRPPRPALVPPHRPGAHQAQRRRRAGRGSAPLPAWRSRLEDDLLANRLFEGGNRLAAARPALVPAINRLSARADRLPRVRRRLVEGVLLLA